MKRPEAVIFDLDGAGAASAGMSFVKVSDSSYGTFVDLHLEEE